MIALPVVVVVVEQKRGRERGIRVEVVEVGEEVEEEEVEEVERME